MLSHKISTSPPDGRTNLSSLPVNCPPSQVQKNTVESRKAPSWCASCPRGKKEERQGWVQIWLFAAWEQITQKIPGNNEKKDISVTKTMGGCIGEIQRWTAAQKKNRLEVRGPLVPYPQTTFAPSKTALVPFLSPFRLPFFLSFVPIESKAKQKSFVYLFFDLLDEREQSFVSGFMDWIQSAKLIPFYYVVTGYRRTLPKATLSSFRRFTSLK